MSASPHRLVLASAGTGKTHRLTGRFLELLFAGVGPERILATTFTRKAAGEILERVLERLVEAAEDPDELALLGESLGGLDVTADSCRGLLARLTRSLDTFQVRTLDSFFVHLARLFALDLGLPPGWGIASAREDDALQAEALQDVLERGSTAEMVELLRELHGGGAGRGVQRTMLERARNLRAVFLESAEGAWDRVEAGANPSDGEVAAAVERLRRAEVPLTGKGIPSKPWVKAIEAVLGRVEREEWEGLLESGLGHKVLSGERSYSRKPIPEEMLGALAPILARARHVWLTTLRARNLATLSLLEGFEAAYAERKREGGGFRFDDLPLALAPRAGQALPIDARDLDLWFRLDGRIDHLLLDEFQDTSPLQWSVLGGIAAEIAADGTGERSFFCVGDVKQSIYAFRHAEPRLLAELDRLLPGLEPEPMRKSYRSSAVVLGAVNHVFADLEENRALAAAELAPYRIAAKRWQKGFPEHVPARDLPGAAFVLEAREGALLERTVERVERIAAEAPEATVGVLMRENKHIPGLIQRLRRAGIDASGEGGSELVDSEAVLAFVSLLHLADHPGDAAAAFHVASTPFGAYVGLGIGAGAEDREAVARGLRGRLVAEGLGAVCADFARRVAEDGGWSAWDRARFAQLLDLAHAFEAGAGLRPSDFVDHVRVERVEAPGGSRVRVMTVHKAKGLEFDAVVLPELTKKLVGSRAGLLVERPEPDGPIETVSVSPKQELLVADRNLRELYDHTTERMVEDALSNLYVAMTRAARRLELILPVTEKPGKVPTAADLVRAALPPAEVHEPDEQGVIWSHPDDAPGAGWADGLGSAGGKAPAPEPPLASLALAPSTRPRHLPRRSPSAEEGGRRVRAADLLRPKEAARRGTLVHRWLADLEWLEDFDLDEDRLLAIGATLEPDPAARRTALSDLAAALAKKEVRAALSRTTCRAPAGCTLEVKTEHAFSTVLPILPGGESGEEELWTGSIDRLVLARRGDDVVWAEILDHKTDRMAEADLDDRVAFYRPQLEAYARVVAAQTGLEAEAIPLRLVFLSPGRVVDVRSG